MLQMLGGNIVPYVVHSSKILYDHCPSGKYISASDALQLFHDPGLRCQELDIGFVSARRTYI